MSTYHIYVKASKTPIQNPAGLEAESSSTPIVCVCVCVCACVRACVRACVHVFY